MKGAGADHFEYKLNDDSWVHHEDSKLVLGPLEIGRYELQVRAVNAHGVKDPVPARFIWNVNEAVDVQLDNPPVNTKAQTSQVAVKSSPRTSPSALTVAQNKQVRPQSGPVGAGGSHASGVGGQSNSSARLFVGARGDACLWSHGHQRGGGRNRLAQAARCGYRSTGSV